MGEIVGTSNLEDDHFARLDGDDLWFINLAEGADCHILKVTQVVGVEGQFGRPIGKYVFGIGETFKALVISIVPVHEGIHHQDLPRRSR